MMTDMDKEVLKEALRELIREEPDTFKALIKEVLAEEKKNVDEEFEQLLQKNFDRFGDTFKALA